MAILPYFNPDLDQEPLPEPVRKFRQKISEAQALLISTPEYAHGIPGVLKNSLDWLVSDPNFAGKPVDLIYGSATDASFAQTSVCYLRRKMAWKKKFG